MLAPTLTLKELKQMKNYIITHRTTNQIVYQFNDKAMLSAINLKDYAVLTREEYVQSKEKTK